VGATKGVGRKISRRGLTIKDQNLAKNTEKWHYLTSSKEEGAGQPKKKPKIAKKGEK